MLNSARSCVQVKCHISAEEGLYSPETALEEELPWKQISMPCQRPLFHFWLLPQVTE